MSRITNAVLDLLPGDLKTITTRITSQFANPRVLTRRKFDPVARKRTLQLLKFGSLTPQ